MPSPLPLLALALLLGTVPVVAAAAPLPAQPVPAVADEAVRDACGLVSEVPLDAALVQDLLACGGDEDARAGPAKPQAKAEPVADAQPEAAAVEELAGLAQGFAAESLADPASVPSRAPGLLEAVVAWLDANLLQALPAAAAQAGEGIAGACQGAADAVAGLGLGADGAVRGAGQAVHGTLDGAAGAVADLGQHLAQLLRGASQGPAPSPPAQLPGGVERAPGKAGDLLGQVRALL